MNVSLAFAFVWESHRKIFTKVPWTPAYGFRYNNTNFYETCRWWIDHALVFCVRESQTFVEVIIIFVKLTNLDKDYLDIQNI